MKLMAVRCGSVALAVWVATVCSIVALADTNYDLAQQLGNVISSQKRCGFEVDEIALQNAIEREVKPDDLEFPDTLETSIWSQGQDIEKFDTLQLKLHCKQIIRAAKQRGMIK